jgi:hypothetical protein
LHLKSFYSCARPFSVIAPRENNPQNAEQPFSRLKSQLREFGGIQDRICRPENDRDEQSSRHVFADYSGPATLLEQRAEMSALAMVSCLEGVRGGGCLGGINQPVRLRPVYPARPPISILAILL